MNSNYLKKTTRFFCVATGSLLLASGLAFGQQQVNLTAGPSIVTLPDGQTVSMWGYSCQPLASGTTSMATCAALNPSSKGWSPVVITVPTGQDLQINLTNNLTFQPPTPAGSTTAPAANNIPTSLVIVGQLGGGLGDPKQRSTSAAPEHGPQSTTWTVANVSGAINNPPQGTRVQSFSTEVSAGSTTPLCWGSGCTTPTPPLRPGTYLIESGTHPSIQGPMGLYGILVVTSAASGTNPGTAYPSVNYNAEVPLLFSEIDPAQNKAVTARSQPQASWRLPPLGRMPLSRSLR
jgi:hypothetical protein